MYILKYEQDIESLINQSNNGPRPREFVAKDKDTLFCHYTLIQQHPSIRNIQIFKKVEPDEIF